MPGIDRRRRGAVLVAALVCLLVVMALIGNMLLGALRANHQLRVERDFRQCELLLAAGIQHAAEKLSRDAAYEGEEWRLTSEEIVGHGEGAVTITVVRSSQDNPTHIDIVAEYPLGSELSIRRSRSIPVRTPVPENDPSSQE